MSVKLSNFVQIAIKKYLTPSFTTTREVAVLLNPATPIADVGYYRLGGTGDGSTVAAAASPYTTGTTTFKNKFFEVFFNNGGRVLHVVSALTDLPREEIVIAIPSTDTISYASNTELLGPDEKIYVKIKTTTPTAVGTDEGLVYKYEASTTGLYAGTSVMATLAYFSKLKIYDKNAAKDYAFTAEIIDSTNYLSTTDNTVVAACLAYHVNCMTYLAGANRNIGGDDCVGNDLTNLFMRIVLQQTMTDRLINLLSSKIKYDDRGITSVKAAIASELARFVNNGYIATDKAWTDEDLYINDELIISKNSPLLGGYKIHIAGFDTLTQAQRDDRQFPNIYVLYGDAYSIRKIVVNGEVF